MKSVRFLAVCLLILSLASAADSSPAPFSGRTITRIDIHDDQGRPWGRPEQILPLIVIKPGEVFSGPAIRDGIALLYLKGMFKDIRVDAFPDEGGVRLEYTLFPITVVEKIVIHGNHALSTTTIREALPGIEGKELRDEKFVSLRNDLIALYQAQGYYHATVTFLPEPLAIPYRVALHVNIEESAPTIIEDITFSGNTVFSDEELLSVMKSRKGSPVRRDLLLDRDREAIRNKYAEAGYPATKAGHVDMSFRDHKAYVHILGDEGPKVTVRFIGNMVHKPYNGVTDYSGRTHDTLSDIGLTTMELPPEDTADFESEKLMQELLIWSEHDVSDSVIEGSVEKIKTLYRENGYADAAVEVHKDEKPGALDLLFTIRAGPRISVKEITILGNSAFKTNEIKGQMALRESGWFTRRPFREDLLEQDIDYLRDRYLDAGYLAATVKSNVVFSSDRSLATVVVDITEGQQTMTGTVTYEGNRVFSEKELMAMVDLKPGTPFNERLIDEDRYRILTAYSNRGHLYARVEAEKSQRNGNVDIHYRITEDMPVFIGRIILRGNERTKDHVILRELLVKQGYLYNYSAILNSQQRIYRLGYIRVARFEPVHPGEKDYVKDMLLSVEEGPAGAVEFGVGYGNLDRFRASVEALYRNLWGTARYTSFRYEQSDILQRAIFNYHEPWVFGRDLDAKFSLVWSDQDKLNIDTRETYYKTRKTTAAFGIEKTYRRLKPSITYQFENVVNYEVKPEAQITPEDSGRVRVSSLSPALILDLRDDVFNPRKGSIYGIILKEALKELGSEADFSKLTVQGSWFQPVRSSVLAFSVRAGMAWPFRETTEVPIHERFYVGGSTTVRGYLQDAIGPSVPDATGTLIPQGGQSMVVLNLEYRINPGEGLGFEIFVDAGNVWPGQAITLSDLRSSYGGGFRYGTPIGPLRLDYGQKINRRSGESPGELHFSIGNTF